MIIGRILSPVHSLGPGNRVCIWTQGCRKHCAGCISEDLQNPNGVQVREEDLAMLLCHLAEKNECPGLTVSGGDPFEQAAGLLSLLRLVRGHFDDILIYTGFEREEIEAGCAGEEGKECLRYIDVLIDGPYVKERNVPDCVLRGSDNQVIHFLNENKRPLYEAYMKRGRQIEPFIHGDKTIITGIFDEVKT